MGKTILKLRGGVCPILAFLARLWANITSSLLTLIQEKN